MSKKHKIQAARLTKHWTGHLDEWEELDEWDEFAEFEDVKRPRRTAREERATEVRSGNTKGERRQREKEWGRDFHRAQRTRRREANQKP